MSFSDLGRSLLFLINSTANFDLVLSDNRLGNIPGNKGERNSPKCTILDGSVFRNFLLADEIFAKALRSL